MITVREEIADFAITRDDLFRLAQYHNTSCISIYIPTHRAGKEALRGHDAINLKNQLKEIRNKLQQAGMTLRQTWKLVNPVSALIEDPDFWRHQSDGLAVFAAEDIFEKYTVPVSFREINYLSNDFYLTPLFPIFNNNAEFHLLTLRKEGVSLYLGNKYGLTGIDLEGLVPSRLEDSVGYDYEQKQVQFRTNLGSNRPGSFHGHGEGESKDKDELLVFFREVDRGIMTKLGGNQDLPLLLCCFDQYYPIYREATSHKNLYPGYIGINPTDLDAKMLHSKAWEIIQPYFGKDLESRKEKFHIAHDKGKASSDIREIIPAAVEGKIDTLFIEKNAEQYGIYDSTNMGLSIQEELTSPNVSLMNLAAKKVFALGGKVYLLDRQEMPDGSSDINALFRY